MNNITHVLLDDSHTKSNATYWDFTFVINRPGTLRVMPSEWTIKLPGLDINGKPYKNKIIPSQWELSDPNGDLFDKPVITLKELDQFRDLRGTIIGKWKLRIIKPEFPTNGTLIQGFDGSVKVSTLEIIKNLSASPLINKTGVLRTRRSETIEIDLNRIGELRVMLASDSSWYVPEFLINPLKNITVTLNDPEGEEFASSTNGFLNCTIKLQDIVKSRNNKGQKKLWSLTVRRPADVRPPTNGYKLIAQVYAKKSIEVSTINDRLEALLGKNGKNVILSLNHNDELEKNILTLELKDKRLAETIGMHDIFDDHLDSNLNDDLDLKNPQVNIPYVLGQYKGWAGPDTTGPDAKKLLTKSIKVEFGPTKERKSYFDAGKPGISIEITTAGSLYTHINNWDDGEFAFPKISIEIGLDTDTEGRISGKVWIDPASVMKSGEGGIWLFGYGDSAFEWVVSNLSNIANYFIKKPFADTTESILDFLNGGRFDYTSIKWDNTSKSFVFECIAGVEPERIPNPGYIARGNPLPSQHNPGNSKILKDKIEHIVVLMMENRSFDHVLGYRSLNGIDTSDGLTEKIRTKFKLPHDLPDEIGLPGDPRDRYKLRHLPTVFLSDHKYPATKFPFHVGHSYEDTAEQMGTRKNMKGFVKNFLKHYDINTIIERGYLPKDVMGYYTGEDLPMCGFLADEFAICDKVFCSHPGPTMPNRMFSLMGDLYKTPYGEPQLNNDVGDFSLTRQTNIFDILTQQGVSWRQYESPPSVSMLRYFARYAGNDTKIRDIKHLKDDINNPKSLFPNHKDSFPSVTFIDPAFHYAPANDDHPPADMMKGQHFIKKVYSALRSNDDLWKKTLFIITYDEHGGFFDHVVPPLAEILEQPRSTGVESGNGRKPSEEVYYGLRVPTFLISPYIEKGSVYSSTWDFTSILKTILNKFCADTKPFLSDRVSHAEDLSAALTLSTAREITKKTPKLSDPVTDESEKQVKFHKKSDLTKPGADWHNFMEVLGRIVKT